MGKFLYVGGFALPDCNAAAQRVMSIAKSLREVGHEVIFLNYSERAEESSWKTYGGFSCYEKTRKSLIENLISIYDAQKIIVEQGVTSVIAYNYPAVALCRLLAFCKRKAVACYVDVTEWYVAHGNIIFRCIKTVDTELRMRYLHLKSDGIIAISEYLYQYYHNKVKTIKIPPTVDAGEEKWRIQPIGKQEGKTVFVYAGSPSAQKERLDLILSAAQNVNKQHDLTVRIIGITEQQYEKMYNKQAPKGYAEFLGRISHNEVIQQIRSADWSIIIRDNNKVVQAGFPTKIAESITCGVPVIANEFSNITDYLDKDNSIICTQETIEDAIMMACTKRLSVKKDMFDYHRYSNEIKTLFL